MNAAAPPIEVEGIWKRYCRSLKKSLRYGVQDVTKELIGRGQEAHGLRPSEFWALKDVSLTVDRGESVGLIGHNGAGKTTLLKLINGLVKPTQGKITVRGSVRALIALGTGFNPVLTGRDNIRVASAILGYSEKQAQERAEEIIAFSELEEFIDTPVQSYSSGMLARLGFAVAVHTQPDILLVDEVLAVGDLKFGMKCFQKINDFRSGGGAIMLVSHNPYTIRANCDRVAWLERGVVREIGETSVVCDRYEVAMARDSAPTAALVQEHGDGTVRVVEVECSESIESGDEIEVRIALEARRTLIDPIVHVTLTAAGGQHIAVNDTLADDVQVRIDEGRTEVILRYPIVPLRPGLYGVTVAVSERYMTNLLVMDLNRAMFEVRRKTHDHGAGVLSLNPEWKVASARIVR